MKPQERWRHGPASQHWGAKTHTWVFTWGMFKANVILRVLSAEAAIITLTTLRRSKLAYNDAIVIVMYQKFIVFKATHLCQGDNVSIHLPAWLEFIPWPFFLGHPSGHSLDSSTYSICPSLSCHLTYAATGSILGSNSADGSGQRSHKTAHDVTTRLTHCDKHQDFVRVCSEKMQLPLFFFLFFSLDLLFQIQSTP